MLLSEPMPSQYDWRFSLFGFPIRVTWLFWLINAAFGYQTAVAIDRAYSFPNSYSPGAPSLLVIWVGAVFLSILIHELGHALAFRYFGIDSEIVLYHMGGMAIPSAGYLYQRRGRRSRLSHWDQIIVSASGPGLQFLAGVLVVVAAVYFRINTQTVYEAAGLLRIDMSDVPNPRSAWMYSAVDFFAFVSLWWPLFNLIPVFPLDGGHIAMNLFAIFRRTDGRYEGHLLGAIVGFGFAFWFYSHGSPINAMFFASMAMSNIQALQQLQGPGIW